MTSNVEIAEKRIEFRSSEAGQNDVPIQIREAIECRSWTDSKRTRMEEKLLCNGM